MIGTFLAKRGSLPCARPSPGLKDAAWLGNCQELSAARRRSSDAFGSILDQAADAVIFADRSGKVRRRNRVSAALFGFSAAEALGQSLDLIVPEHLRAALARVR